MQPEFRLVGKLFLLARQRMVWSRWSTSRLLQLLVIMLSFFHCQEPAAGQSLKGKSSLNIYNRNLSHVSCSFSLPYTILVAFNIKMCPISVRQEHVPCSVSLPYSMFYVLSQFSVPNSLFQVLCSLFFVLCSLFQASFSVFCSLFHLVPCSQFLFLFYLFHVCSNFPVYFSMFRVTCPSSFLFFVLSSCSLFLGNLFLIPILFPLFPIPCFRPHGTVSISN